MELLIFEPLDDCEQLKTFSCGVEQMDDFIHSRLQDAVSNHYCRVYIVKNQAGEILAFFALSFDSLEFDQDAMDDLFSGASTGDVPRLSSEYIADFKSKLHHPALEITFLAVRKTAQADEQGKGIGSFIVESIAQMAVEQKMAGCEFLTVEAYHTSEYSATGFYNKCHFGACECPSPHKDTLRMYRILYT